MSPKWRTASPSGRIRQPKRRDRARSGETVMDRARPGRPLDRILRARRMIRAFTDEPLDPRELDGALDLARRAPAAGNTSAIDFLVLDTPGTVAAYWDTTLSAEKRSTFRWQGLLHAPALVVVATRPDAYVDRYAEPDKARAKLGADAKHWAQPFWWIDAGMVVENLLLIATDRGWGASLFGIFDHEAAVKQTFSVPEDRRLVCTVALGWPSDTDEPGRSAGRERAPLEQIIHRGSW